MAKVENDFHIIKDSIKEDKHVENYTILGSHDYIDDNHNPRSSIETESTLAQKITYPSGNIKYFIKIGPYGKIYNPIGMYTEGTANKFLTKFGKKAWDFKSVNQKIFELYINFLRTKNIAWLNNAEREMT